MPSLTINTKNISKSYDSMDSIWQQARGLMFQNKVKKPLIFKFAESQKIPLHMWFVFCTIDVLYLDEDKVIIEMKQNFKPFAYYSPKKKAKYVIELAQNTIKNNNIKLKQKVKF